MTEKIEKKPPPKERRVNLRFDDVEIVALERAAKRAGLTVTAYCAEKSLAAAEREGRRA
jgi:uncharacterized protein (DUF1778 family)